MTFSFSFSCKQFEPRHRISDTISISKNFNHSYLRFVIGECSTDIGMIIKSWHGHNLGNTFEHTSNEWTRFMEALIRITNRFINTAHIFPRYLSTSLPYKIWVLNIFDVHKPVKAFDVGIFTFHRWRSKCEYFYHSLHLNGYFALDCLEVSFFSQEIKWIFFFNPFLLYWRMNSNIKIGRTDSVSKSHQCETFLVCNSTWNKV